MKYCLTLCVFLQALAFPAEPVLATALPRRAPRTLIQLSRAISEAMSCASTGLAGGLIGIDVVQISTGRALYQMNAANQFMPASNAKLYTTAAALMRLGPDFRYETRVAAATAPIEGRLSGDLYLIGGGDPTLASRHFPLASPPGPGQSLRDIEVLADEVVANGVRQIDGAVIGDDTIYPLDRYPVGWTVDDSIWDYGAPVSGLTIHDNVIQVRLAAPLAAGALTQVALDPPLEYFTIDNRVTAGRETKVTMSRMPGSRELVLNGTVEAGAIYWDTVAIDDPARYAAIALAEALERRGVSVRGGVASRSRTLEESADPLNVPVILAKRVSPPLAQSLQIIDKISQNLYAELVLREIGRQMAGSATRQGGLSEVYKLIWESGARTECCYFQDGSGLSRQTLISPFSTVKLLQYMYHSKYRDTWLSLLPIGGVDGSLGKRFDKAPEARRIRAKTGSIAHVGTMSGYAESATFGTLAFSVLFNNYNSTDGDEITYVLDRIGLALVE